MNYQKNMMKFGEKLEIVSKQNLIMKLYIMKTLYNY